MTDQVIIKRAPARSRNSVAAAGNGRGHRLLQRRRYGKQRYLSSVARVPVLVERPLNTTLTTVEEIIMYVVAVLQTKRLKLVLQFGKIIHKEKTTYYHLYSSLKLIQRYLDAQKL